jgi:hypothetical protein
VRKTNNTVSNLLFFLNNKQNTREDRVREQAVLALPRVAEFVERRADLARLLAAVAPLLAKETDDDLRLAALDAAQELLDILGRAALPQDATGEVARCGAPPFSCSHLCWKGTG